MPKINYTCSLGELCQSSQILKRNMNKTCSYPFDWIFSNSNVIIARIRDLYRDKTAFTNKQLIDSINIVKK